MISAGLSTEERHKLSVDVEMDVALQDRTPSFEFSDGRPVALLRFLSAPVHGGFPGHRDVNGDFATRRLVKNGVVAPLKPQAVAKIVQATLL